MKLPLVLVALLGLGLCAWGDDSAVAKQLEAKGGKVKEAGGSVSELTFTDCAPLEAADFEAIGKLPHLKNLTLYGGKKKLTDETVGALLGLKELENFSSEGGWLSDAGLAKLSALSSLKSAAFFHLSINMEGFTGKGFAAWKALPHLERLTVAGMSMGDEALGLIAQIPALRDFSTWHTYQTQAGNAAIAKMPLTSLRIGQRLQHRGADALSLTDESLATLAKIQTLQKLTLMEGQFTLAGLKALKSLPALKQVQVAPTAVSATDLDGLRKEFPAVKIEVLAK
jgi:hypothetical protein